MSIPDSRVPINAAMPALPDDSDAFLLLHNPGCTKSRALHALLTERGVPFAERAYLEEPLDTAELGELERRLGRPIGDWVRPREAAWAQAGVRPEGPAGEVRAAVAIDPVLMERPILVRGARAVVGRPPEAALVLLDPA